MKEEMDEMNEELDEQIKLIMDVLETLEKKAETNKYAFKRITISADIKADKTGKVQLVYDVDGLSGHKEDILKDLANQDVIKQAENIKDII